MAGNPTVRSVYEAYLRGDASLDDVVKAADEFTSRYAARGRTEQTQQP